jgi:hypothetical protein
MGVRWDRCLGIAENVVNQRQEGAESLGGSLEHMFVTVGAGADGSGGLQRVLQEGGKPAPGREPSDPARGQEPSEDQTSSFVRMRSTTAPVNSVVPV